MTGEAGDEHQRVAADHTTDLRAPVLSRPQAGCVAPHRDPGGFEHLLTTFRGSGLQELAGYPARFRSGIQLPYSFGDGSVERQCLSGSPRTIERLLAQARCTNSAMAASIHTATKGSCPAPTKTRRYSEAPRRTPGAAGHRALPPSERLRTSRGTVPTRHLGHGRLSEPPSTARSHRHDHRGTSSQ